MPTNRYKLVEKRWWSKISRVFTWLFFLVEHLWIFLFSLALLSLKNPRNCISIHDSHEILKLFANIHMSHLFTYNNNLQLWLLHVAKLPETCYRREYDRRHCGIFMGISHVDVDPHEECSSEYLIVGCVMKSGVFREILLFSSFNPFNSLPSNEYGIF